MRKIWLFPLLVLLALVPLSARAEVITPYDVQASLSIGRLTELELPGDSGARLEYVFTPEANGEYGVYLFRSGEDLQASAELWTQDELLASGEGEAQLLTARLSAGRQYTLKLFGNGRALLEISRETLSRSFAQPMALEGAYTKRIAKAGDAHWYEFTGDQELAALISCTPRERGLRLSAWLFSEEGLLVGRAETLPSGTAVYSLRMVAGARFRLRIAAQSQAVGSYEARLDTSPVTAMPQSVSLSADELEMQGREVASLTAQRLPSDSCPLLLLDATDPEVARADGSGYVISGQAGVSVLTAYAWGGARSACRVQVARVAVENVAFAQEALTLFVGDTTALDVTLEPANATERGVRWYSEDESVAVIAADGIVRAVGTGKTGLVVETVDGRLVDRLVLTVDPAEPRFRALLIGEQAYAQTVEKPRDGSIKSVTGVSSLLGTTAFGKSGYQVTTVMDMSRDGVLAALRKAFAGAQSEDLSLLYITCHGFYRAGMTFFLMVDGSVLAASDLEKELRAIPGTVVVIADCCGSGGLIGAAGEQDDLLRGIMGVFTGATGGKALAGDRYKVLASAYLEQDSYRVGFRREDGVEMATVFARALCDAGGWSLEENRRTAMKADVDYDGRVTLDELENYVSRRVMWYLEQAGAYAQSVCAWPEGDTTVLFERRSAE